MLIQSSAAGDSCYTLSNNVVYVASEQKRQSCCGWSYSCGSYVPFWCQRNRSAVPGHYSSALYFDHVPFPALKPCHGDSQLGKLPQSVIICFKQWLRQANHIDLQDGS